MKNIYIFFLILLITKLDSETIEKRLEITKYKDFSYIEKNVELVRYSNQPAYYELKRKILPDEKDIDLYISFDEDNSITLQNYKVINKKFLKTENRGLYKSGGYFTGDKDKIELAGNDYSFFQPGVNLGSFSISFWVYPVTFSGEETILKIGSQYYNKSTNSVEDESIVAKIKNGKVIWEFNNLFKLRDNIKKSIELTPFTIIEPEKWNHINLTYDSYKGIVKEFINGSEVALAIATDTNNIDGSVLNLRFHPTNRCIVRLGASFCGAIDEFIIAKNSKQITNERYESNGGVIYSNVLEIEKVGAFISKIEPNWINENRSEIQLSFRGSDKIFYPEEEYSKDIKWIGLNDVKNYSSKKIRYIQFRLLFLPGTNQEYSSKLKDIKLVYDKNLPPSKPLDVKAFSTNGKIKLKWLKNSEKDLKGYKLYYGTKSNNYFCNDAKEGESPIDIGLVNEFELTNLKKNILYYISITAYDDNEGKNESEFSEEILYRVLE